MSETRVQWNSVEDARLSSPLGSLNLTDAALDIAYEVRRTSGIELSTDFVVELAVASETLLSAEDLAELEPDWGLIESDVSVAVEVRQMLARRKRWAFAYDRHMNLFRRQLVDGFRDLIAALPDGCFEESERDDTPFSVPLLSLLENPAQTVERILASFYDTEVLRHDLFHRFRKYLGSNFVKASGFAPGTDPDEVAPRLVMPSGHKSESAAELVEFYLGGTPFEDILNLPVPFRVPESMRFEHCHVIGGTGHGKTQLLQRMIHADLLAAKQDGRSVVVIDSQGDLIQKLVRLDLFDPDHPDSLADRLVVIDPSDVEFPPALNLFDVNAGRLAEYGAADRERAFNGLVELYETFFGALLGAELTQKQGVIFRYLARLMLAIPGASIHTLMQLMEDGKPFRRHMDELEGSTRYFFETEFFHPSFAATKKQILKRLWGVLSTPAFERMFAQRENKLDLFEAMNDGKIVLVSTAKDLLKSEGSALFGRFFIAMIAQAALERSAIPEWRRNPTFLYVDEAQEYFDDTIETILSQARKYRVRMTLAHQTLDQLDIRLRAAFLSNTSLKCAGGVSAKDARALASELHTTADFIEGMRKRRDRTEFAVWLKHRTPTALRLDVPLGSLERQPTLSEEAYDKLQRRNRARYCGTRADVLSLDLPKVQMVEAPTRGTEEPTPPRTPAERSVAVRTYEASETSLPRIPTKVIEPGKGGPKHKYLQALVKDLAEQQGFRATVEAPLPAGSGQVDVLLSRDEVQVAIEISATTPVEQERENVRKCLSAGFPRVALVLAKSRATQGRYRAAILETLSDEERARVSFLAPEDIPDYISALAPAPAPSESVVRGYRVKVSHTVLSPDEAKDRRDRLTKVIARSMRQME